MARFHFMQAYKAHVRRLLAALPLDEAMSEAVGGHYRLFGAIERDILVYAGLRDGMRLIDYGCGSGRLASTLGEALSIDYLGVDIDDDLLRYARSKSPRVYVFRKHEELSVPAESASVDMICAFSLFTHLLQTESYIYLQEMHRVLKEGGRLVFSFLEFEMPSHWSIFEDALAQRRAAADPPLTMFMERSVVRMWAERLGFEIIEIVGGDVAKFDGKALGQSLVILQK